jgi:hypothetical protein
MADVESMEHEVTARSDLSFENLAEAMLILMPTRHRDVVALTSRTQCGLAASESRHSVLGLSHLYHLIYIDAVKQHESSPPGRHFVKVS